MDFFSSNSAADLILSPTHEAETSAASCALQEEVLSLFALLRVRLLRYAVSFGVSLHDGEDIVQEVFLALFCHLQQGRSRENLQGWTFRVTHNLALKRRMANKAEGTVADADLSTSEQYRDAAPGPEEQLLFSERQAHLRSVLRALPEVDQCCLHLRAEGLKYREISKVLGISLGSVASSLSRSLARLERMERLETR